MAAFTSPFASKLYDATEQLPQYSEFSGAMGFNNWLGPQALNTQEKNVNQQQAFVNSLISGNGLNAPQQGVFNQQGALANQYQALAAGQGPNPAQTMLAQNTGQNMQQQAAMMAGARGAQSNPGMIARQAALQGGQMQQQAVGQAATLGAQQQLGAMQAQAGQQGQMANLATAGVGQQQTALSQLGNQNLAYQQMIAQGISAQNQQRVGAQIANTNASAGIQNTAMNNSAGMAGGAMQGIGLLGAAALLAQGGQVPGYADGGPVGIQQQTSGALPNARASLAKMQIGLPVDNTAPKSGAAALQTGVATGINAFGSAAMSLLGRHTNGDTINIGGGNDMSSQMNPNLSGSFSGSTDLSGPLGAGAMGASKGGKVSGKAKTKGDSYSNDTVSAKLSPGEIVIPRSHVDNPGKAASFLNGLMGWNLRAA